MSLAPETLSLADLDGFDPSARKKGTEWRFLCPLCHGDRPRDFQHRTLGVNADTGAWTCHRCHAGGLLIEYRTKPTGAKVTASKQGAKSSKPFAVTPKIVTTGYTPQASQSPPKEKTYDYAAIIAHSRALEGTPAQKYLEGRLIASRAIRTAKVRYMPAFPKWGIKESVAFGLSGPQGDTVAVQFRAIEGADKRIYKRSEDKYAFLTPGALKSKAPIITEAPIDALTLYACGYPAIATCGTSFPEWLAEALALRPRVLLGHDSDQAGDLGAIKAASALRAYGSSPERLKPQGAKDWNEYAQRFGLDRLMAELDQTIGAEYAIGRNDDGSPDPFADFD